MTALPKINSKELLDSLHRQACDIFTVRHLMSCSPTARIFLKDVLAPVVAQQFLKGKAYYAGEIDGQWGPLSEAAASQFSLSYMTAVGRVPGRKFAAQALVVQVCMNSLSIDGLTLTTSHPPLITDGIYGTRTFRRLHLHAVSEGLTTSGYTEVIPLISDKSEIPLAENAPFATEDLDFIVQHEVGNKGYYDKKLRYPTWPGASSGVTIGFGYDLGYKSKQQFVNDWREILPASDIVKLTPFIGLKGQAARKALAAEYVDVCVSWDEAMYVFRRATVPRFWKLTCRTFKGIDKLPVQCKIALLSLVFNRGASLSSRSSRREMVAISTAMGFLPHIHKIPGHIRGMKRLWEGKGLRGLLRRRDAEAKLFQEGLDEGVGI